MVRDDQIRENSRMVDLPPVALGGRQQSSAIHPTAATFNFVVPRSTRRDPIPTPGTRVDPTRPRARRSGLRDSGCDANPDVTCGEPACPAR
jgi:hypothetical protein